MASPIYGSPNFSTTLNVGGGINNSQTTGIVLTSVSGLNTGGGILGVTWASALDTSTYEEIEYTGISGNELTGVTRGVAGTSGKAHNNGATVVAVVSSLHNNRIADKLRSVDATLSQDPNGNEIIKTSYNASAVNEITITNAATGNAPTISATGGDTNIDISIVGKGTGGLSLTSPKIITGINDTNGNELFKVTATGSAVNEITVANAATGSGPTLSATGGDTDIDLTISGKGAGKVKFGNAWATHTPTWGGFSADPTGTFRWLQLGKIVYVNFTASGNGTSNATTLTATLPVAAASTERIHCVGRATDNGAVQTTPVTVSLTASSTTATFFKDLAESAWTGSGNKSANFSFFYETA